MKEFIEIPFGAKDSELCGWEYTIPEGYTASIENGKIVVKKEDTDDEDIKSCIAMCLTDVNEQRFKDYGTTLKDCIAWLEKQGNKDTQVLLPTFTFDDILALQCCMETTKKVQEDKDLYEKLNDLHGRVYDAYQLEKRSDNCLVNFDEAEKEKYDFVSGQYIQCRASFNEFKEDNSYWFEYIGNDTYVGRSDNILNKKFHITPRQLYRLFTQQHYYYSKENNEFEKQGEQKPTDKVEPKFKIEKDKWYVCIKDLLDNYANTAFHKGDTYLSTQDGSLMPSNSNVPFEVACPDTYFRDWTIQDAKDGDVLFGSEWGVILMFRGIGNTEWDNVIDYHCYYDCRREDFIVQKDFKYWGNTENNQLKPATKEQREQIFQKIKEAGYEWDAEKKELKKIEPKFKVGDWVVRGNITAQILDIQEQYYVGIDTNGNDFTSSRFLSDDKIHLWTIKDAKDGDVLCVKYGNDEMPFIFTGKQDDIAYCALNSFGEFVLSVAEWLLKISVLPATKEQRELLFQKMEEAGYTWNAEQKKLSQSKEIISEQSWSEEDSEAIGQAIIALESFNNIDKSDNHFAGYSLSLEDAIKRLKSFKQRMKG